VKRTPTKNSPQVLRAERLIAAMGKYLTHKGWTVSIGCPISIRRDHNAKAGVYEVAIGFVGKPPKAK